MLFGETWGGVADLSATRTCLYLATTCSLPCYIWFKNVNGGTLLVLPMRAFALFSDGL